MASTNLSLRHIFGVNSSVTDNISFTDDDTIVYIAGHSIVLYSLVDKRQRFLQSSEISDAITAYTSGPGKRLAAVAERGEKPTIHIFDLRTFRRKKTLTTSDLLTKEIVSMQFSEDNQMLLALTSSPDWSLLCYNWAKAKLVASTSVSLAGLPMYKCMFSPLDASVVTVIGKDTVKFYRIGEKDIRPLQENNLPNNNFTCFCWMRFPDDHLLTGTDDGKICLFRSGEFVTMLRVSPGSQYPITSLTSISGGFVAGSSPGTFFFFTYDESKDQALFDNQFKLVNTVSASEMSTGSVISMAICPKDERICALTSDSQLLLIPVISTPTINVENVKFAVTSFHGPKSIVGLDVAVRKPLIITCSKDNTLKIWNFKNHELELNKVYLEEMYAVAIHPTGLHCAVGFTDKLRVYHILVDDLRICMEVSIKSCRECRFNAGGNYLAATNGNSIIVYDFYNGEKIADLRGHNSKVRSLHWMPSGCHLLTCGLDGAVYHWALDGSRRIGEFVHKGTMYTSVVNSTSSVLVVGNDRSLRELALPELNSGKVHDAGLILTNIAITNRNNALFASTFEYAKPGYIRAYPYPLNGEFDDYPCTNSQISRLRLTLDENFLIVGDEQGCLCIMELRGRQERFQRNTSTAYNDLLTLPDWSDEVLVTRAELEDCNTLVNDLKSKVDELKLNNEYQLKLKDMNYSEKLKETNDKFIQELEIAKSRFEMLQEVRVDYEIEAIEKLKYMEEMHQSNVQNLETGFQAQIMELVDKYQKLARERDAQVERLDEQRKSLVQNHERYADELTQDYNHKLNEDHHLRLQINDEKNELNRELDEVQHQLSDDIRIEIENMKKKYEEKLTVSREMTLKYKGENGIMKKKSILLQREIEDHKEEIKLLMNKEKELHETIRILEKEISLHKKEIKIRDGNIGEKEKRIYELKKKNQELDKFKFVLDYKIRELKQQIEPKQMEILTLRENIKTMDEKLENFHTSNTALDTLIGELRGKIDALQLDVKNKRIEAKTIENIIEQSRSDIQTMINYIQSPNELIHHLTKIYQSYAHLVITPDHKIVNVTHHHLSTKDGTKINPLAAELLGIQGNDADDSSIEPRLDPDVEREYNRHREYLSRSILMLKKSLKHTQEEHMTKNNMTRDKNMSLINEINTQREINRNLRNSVQADIGRVRHLLQSMNMKKQKFKDNKDLVDQAQSVLANLVQEHEQNKANDINTKIENILESIDPVDLLEKNRKRIQALRTALEQLQAKNETNMNRALSREVLPPLEGANTADRENSAPNTGRKYANSVGIALPPIQREPEYNNNIQGQSDVLDLEDSTMQPDISPRDKPKTYTTEYRSPRA